MTSFIDKIDRDPIVVLQMKWMGTKSGENVNLISLITERNFGVRFVIFMLFLAMGTPKN